MAGQLTIDKKKTAVLIMDYQNRMLNELSEPARKEILEKANSILAKARKDDIPVIYIEVRGGERTPEMEIHPGVTPRSGEVVLTKKRTGPFTTTNLNEVLKKFGADTLVLFGIATQGCVLTTVRCGADLDYKLVVVSDCCANPPSEEVNRILMEKVFPGQASVVTTKEVLAVL
ncbi:MAG: cysteine hydrolase [Dehalococcoidales bacterium]|jgi:nicotinamidase-related amidase